MNIKDGDFFMHTDSDNIMHIWEVITCNRTRNLNEEDLVELRPLTHICVGDTSDLDTIWVPELFLKNIPRYRKIKDIDIHYNVSDQWKPIDAPDEGNRSIDIPWAESVGEPQFSENTTKEPPKGEKPPLHLRKIEKKD